MDYAGRNCECLSGLQPKRLASVEIDFQLALQDDKALIRVGMPMPAELPLHYGHANAMVVDVANHEVLIGLLNGSCFPFQIDNCQWGKRRFLDMSASVFTSLSSVICHGHQMRDT
jgi:hypothetical protein